MQCRIVATATLAFCTSFVQLMVIENALKVTCLYIFGIDLAKNGVLLKGGQHLSQSLFVKGKR